MRTAAIVLTTAVVTAVMTSAIWMMALRDDQPRVPPARATVSPAPARAKIPNPPPAASAPRPAQASLPPAVANAPPPGETSSPPAGTARIGEIPDDLIARQLTIPVTGIDAGALQPSFFDMRGAHAHEAIDIMAARGQPVVAVEDGRIAKLFTSVPGGLTIYQFDPTEKYAYYYAHLDHYADGLSQGDKVSRGQVIGYVGSTGDADAAHPHLHFSIFLLGPEKQWWKGQALDPYPALTKRQSEAKILP